MERNAQGMHKECNKSVVTQLTRLVRTLDIIIGSVVPLPSRPAALGPKSLLSQYIPCGTRACVTTITYKPQHMSPCAVSVPNNHF